MAKKDDMRESQPETIEAVQTPKPIDFTDPKQMQQWYKDKAERAKRQG